MSGFKDWLVKSFGEHPVYTILFGVTSFLVGIMFAGFTG